MFEHRITEEALRKVCRDDRLSNFVDLYQKFIEDKSTDRIRMARFEARVSAAWEAIPRKKRNAVAMALVDKKALPEAIGVAILVFKGEVVRVL